MSYLHWVVEFIGWWFLISVAAAGAWVWIKAAIRDHH